MWPISPPLAPNPLTSENGIAVRSERPTMVVVCTFRRLCSLRDEVYSPPKHKARRASGESLTLTCKRQVTWSGKTPKLGHVGARVGAVSRRVLSVKPGSPAALAGLQCFDRVLCVGSTTLDANTTFDDAWQHSLKATLKVERPSKVGAAEGAALLRSICIHDAARRLPSVQAKPMWARGKPKLALRAHAPPPAPTRS